jgi:ubiquinone biosynthesis protein COQ9
MTEPLDSLTLDDLTLDELAPRLITAMLPHAAFDGWTDKAVAAAAADLGIPASRAALLFPQGASDMMQALSDWTIASLRTALDNGNSLAGMKIRDRVTTAVRTRFETVLGPYKEAIRRGSYILAHPRHAALTAKLTWQTADDIWRMCGDTATDYNHYTKRAILCAVLGSVSLYWLTDTSDSQKDTWAFLDRRIAQVMQFEKAKARMTEARSRMPRMTRFLGRLRYPAA